MVRVFMHISAYASAARRWLLYMTTANDRLRWYHYAGGSTAGYDGYVQHPHHGLLAYWYIENDRTVLSFVW